MDIRELWNRYQAGERDFRGVDLHGETNLFDMTGVDFSEANLSDITLEELEFDNVNFNGANLQRANISKVNFLNSNLSNINLQQAIVRDVGFQEVDLSRANLLRVILMLVSIDKCNLNSADLSEAQMGNIHFVESNLTKSQWVNTFLSPANFIESNLTQADLNKVKAENVELIDTILPNGKISDGRSLVISDSKLKESNIQPIERFNAVELNSSDRDYTKLLNFLAYKRWKAADHETMRIMLQVVNRGIFDFIREEEMQQFPCQVLDTIDRFWRYYSNNHFGFTIQHKIWQNIGDNNVENRERFRHFAEQLGWYKSNSFLSYHEMSFDLSSPTGHLPLASIGCAVFGWWSRNRIWLHSRLNGCDLISSHQSNN